MDLFQRLAAPLPPALVSWRVGTSNKKKRQRETGDSNAKATKGQVLAYIDARDVMDRLDDVCGPGGWQNRYTHAEKKTICEIGIRTPEGEWVWKSDGAGDSDIEAEKGALSDAFKRSAVRWGIGRYLYHLPTPWVDLDEREQIPEAERRKLEALLVRDAQATAPKAATAEPAPDNAAAVADAAIGVLEAYSDHADQFRGCWDDNREEWKRKLPPVQYARVVAAMKRIGAKFAAAETKTNGHTPPPKNDFGLAGDDVPSFS